MTWTDKVKTLAETDEASVSPFMTMDEEEILNHPFFNMLKSLWSNHISQKSSKKKILTDEEKEEFRIKKMNEYFKGVKSSPSTKLINDFKKKFNKLDEDELKETQKKAIVIGLRVMENELDKLSKTAPTATKTLANGKVVANHNNYHRDDDELVKNADGTTKKVVVNFDKSMNEVCGIIKTPKDDSMNKYWTFKELDGCKSVERAEKGHSQVFIKKMGFSNNPSWIEGRCNCANALNKKIMRHAMTESIDEDDDTITYTPKKFKTSPQFCCNKPIFENGVCKSHTRMINENRSVDKWSEDMLNGWTPIYETI